MAQLGLARPPEAEGQRFKIPKKMEKCWVYIIQSEEDGWTYTGHTKDIQKRLREHNNEKMRATRLHKPFKLVYAEECTSRSEAMKRENFLKTGKGRSLKEKLLKQVEASLEL